MILLRSTSGFLGGIFTLSIQLKIFYTFQVHLIYVTRAHASVTLPFHLDGTTLPSSRPDSFLGSTQPPSQLDPHVLLPGINRLVRVTGYLPALSLEAKNEWIYTSTSSICPQGVYRYSISLQWRWCIKNNNKLLDGQEFLCRFPAGQEAFLYSKESRVVLEDNSVSYSIFYQQLFRRQAEAGGNMRLTTHLNLVLSLRIGGALPPLPQM